jgi:hypothetical protein
MDRQSLKDYGLSIGIEYAELRGYFLGEAVRFMHGRCQDILDLEAYERGIYFVDKGEHWVADSSNDWFISRNLTEIEARQVLVWWLAANKQDYLQYQDPEYQSWIEPRRELR